MGRAFRAALGFAWRARWSQSGDVTGRIVVEDSGVGLGERWGGGFGIGEGIERVFGSGLA